jgi:hypothetical protein
MSPPHDPLADPIQTADHARSRPPRETVRVGTAMLAAAVEAVVECSRGIAEAPLEAATLTSTRTGESPELPALA